MHVIPGGQNGPQHRIRRAWLDPQHRPVTFGLRGKHPRHARQTLNRAARDVNDHGRVTRGGWGLASGGWGGAGGWGGTGPLGGTGLWDRGHADGLAPFDPPALGFQMLEPPGIVVDEDDRSAFGQPLRHHLIQRRPRIGIQPGPGLVKHEHPRLGQQRLRDRDLLAHALGHVAHRHARELEPAEPAQAHLDPAVQRVAVQPLNPAEMRQVVLGSERQPGREPLRHESGDRPAGDRALGRHRHPGDHPQQRRLAGPVLAFEPDQPAGLDVQAHVPDDPRLPPAVPLAHRIQPHARPPTHLCCPPGPPRPRASRDTDLASKCS